MKIATVENQRGGKMKAGQKIFHNQFGRGIIVGFSEVSDEPVVYFYDSEVQKFYKDRVISVSSEMLICAR